MKNKKFLNGRWISPLPALLVMLDEVSNMDAADLSSLRKYNVDVIREIEKTIMEKNKAVKEYVLEHQWLYQLQTAIKSRARELHSTVSYRYEDGQKMRAITDARFTSSPYETGADGDLPYSIGEYDEKGVLKKK